MLSLNKPSQIDVRWGPREVLLGIVGLLGANVVAFTLLVSLDAVADGASAPVWAVLVSTMVLQAGVIATAVFLGPGALKNAIALFGPVTLGTPRLFAWGFGAFVGSIALTTVYAEIVTRISPDFLPPPIPEAIDSPDFRVLAFIVVVLLAPAVEETFFRGFFFAGLLARYGFLIAGTASAAVFAATHVDPELLTPAFLSGLVFAFVYWRSGSVWPGILAHTSQNAIAFGLAL